MATLNDVSHNAEAIEGPDHNGDYAVLMWGRPYILYSDGTLDQAACSWDELKAMKDVV